MKSSKLIRRRGYILLPVVLLISLVAVAAFILNNESVVETNVTNASVEIEKVEYVASAGLQHATWQIDQAGCGPFTDVSQSFGKGSYSSQITTNNVGGNVSSITVPVSGDSFIQKDNSTANYGSNAELQVGGSYFGSNYERAIYRFDMENAGIAPGATIVSAVARFYVVSFTHTKNVTVHQITADWDEATVTWGDISNDVNTSPLGSIPPGTPTGQYVEVNITALVQSWINGAAENYGVTLAPARLNGSTTARYTSREYGNVSQRPELVVKVSDGSISNRANVTATGNLANGVEHTITQSDIVLYQPGNNMTLQPDAANGEDAEVWQQQPNNNYGNADETWVSSASNDTTRSLLRFNMGVIPADAKILGATLSLSRRSGSGSNQPVSAHRIINSWDENTVTWDKRKPGVNWDTAGVDFDDIAVATTPVGPVNQRYEWNVTPLVQGWVDSRFPNHGVVLVAAIAGLSGEHFNTSDHADSSLWPSLSITYACECGITCMAPQGSGKVLLVVGDDTNMNATDVKKQSLFEDWGYTITLIDDDKSQSNFDSKINLNDVAYISESIDSTVLGDKLSDTSKGVVNEEGQLNDELGIAGSSGHLVSDSLNIIDNSHYITALFPSGVIPINLAPMEGLVVTGSPAAGLQSLAEFTGVNSVVLIEAGDMLGGNKNGENAIGRRVTVPIGTSNNFNWDYLNNNGRLIVQRAIQWGAEEMVAPIPPRKIYWTDETANKIQRSDEDGSNVEDVITGLDRPTGLDIDTVNGKIYWTNDSEIQRANLDGSNLETLYSGFLVTTFDVKLDVAANKMYWTYDSGLNTVRRADLDGSNSEIISITLDRPAYITLDPDAGHIYLTEFGNGDITRMNLDGSDITALVTGQNNAIGNGIDTTNNKLYWTGGSSNDWIRRSDLNGSNVETIVTGQTSAQDIVVDHENDRIYWVNMQDFTVMRADSSGSNVETIVTGLVRPRAITVVLADDVPPTGIGAGGGGAAIPSGSCDGVFRDEFDLELYDQNNGTLAWATDWEETGEPTNPTAGDIRISTDDSNFQLQVRDDGQTVWREADLSGASSATLSFDYRRENLNGSGDYVALEVSYDSGSNWDELDRFIGTADDSAYTNTSYTLDAGSLSANTRIRFLTPGNGMGNSNKVYFDNVQIECSQ